MLQQIFTYLKNVFSNKDYMLVLEVSDWLTQNAKSEIRKSKPFKLDIATLKYSIAQEFGEVISAKQLVAVINETRSQLNIAGIDLIADTNEVIANRPISSMMLKAWHDHFNI